MPGLARARKPGEERMNFRVPEDAAQIVGGKFVAGCRRKPRLRFKQPRAALRRAPQKGVVRFAAPRRIGVGVKSEQNRVNERAERHGGGVIFDARQRRKIENLLEQQAHRAAGVGVKFRRAVHMPPVSVNQKILRPPRRQHTVKFGQLPRPAAMFAPHGIQEMGGMRRAALLRQGVKRGANAGGLAMIARFDERSADHLRQIGGGEQPFPCLKQPSSLLGWGNRGQALRRRTHPLRALPKRGIFAAQPFDVSRRKQVLLVLLARVREMQAVSRIARDQIKQIGGLRQFIGECRQANALGVLLGEKHRRHVLPRKIFFRQPAEKQMPEFDAPGVARVQHPHRVRALLADVIRFRLRRELQQVEKFLQRHDRRPRGCL